MPILSNAKSFTLVELIVVVIIIGIIAAFAIPNFQTSIERTHRRDAEANLYAIYSANRIYYAEKNVYWPTINGSYNLTNINTSLQLSIIANGMDYSCTTSTSGATYACSSARTGGAWTLQIDQTSPPTITCSVGTCP